MSKIDEGAAAAAPDLHTLTSEEIDAVSGGLSFLPPNPCMQLNRWLPPNPCFIALAGLTR
jgi:hypothetical protein